MEVLFQDESKNKLFFCFQNSSSIPEDLINNKLFNGEREKSFITIQNENEIIMWVGLGLAEESSPYLLFQSGVHAIERVVSPRKIDNIKVHFAEEVKQEHIFFLAEGLLSTSLYNYSEKSDKNEQVELTHIVFEGSQNLVQTAYIVSQARNIAKELVDTPANLMTPSIFADYATQNLSKIGVNVEVWNKEKLEEENLQGLLTVGQSSSNEPCMIRIKHSPSGAKKRIALIGKGVTYDTGGYSLKPAEAMKDMKIDLAGAASVVGIIFGIVSMGLPIEVDAFLPMAENMVSGGSYKPGDIIKYRNGKTVEITNTDAEGRLVLADALLLTQENDYDLVIDIATLTGAIAVALGNNIHGVFANKKAEELAQKYVQFTWAKTADLAWQMPLASMYKEALGSSIADMQNTGGRYGGSITAALFLNDFVKTSQPWMHLDIAGSAFNSKKSYTGRATGSPVESLLLFFGSQFLEL